MSMAKCAAIESWRRGGVIESNRRHGVMAKWRNGNQPAKINVMKMAVKMESGNSGIESGVANNGINGENNGMAWRGVALAAYGGISGENNKRRQWLMANGNGVMA
jgi:hypothetical protein